MLKFNKWPLMSQYDKKYLQTVPFNPLLNNQPYFNEINSLFEETRSDKQLKPKLSIIGLGYVGAVSCACFSSLGHQVIGVDQDTAKVTAIANGYSPIIEKDLDAMLEQGHIDNLLQASTDIEYAIMNSDITLVSVGTPSDDKGACDLTYLKQASRQIALVLAEKDSYHVVIFRSTVPPSTTEKILIPLLEKYSGKKCGEEFGVCFNPEFLRESTAIEDFYNPPKTVIGSFDKKSKQTAAQIYKDVDQNIQFTTLAAAEFVKYIDNTWHALKVSFANEVGRICKSLDVDSHEVMNIFLQDTKLNISPYYMKPGFAFGGSCLPKDTRGISYLAKSFHVETPIINHINESNQCHLQHIINMINKLNVTKIGVIGLTFKTGTDDLRESPSIALIKQLWKLGYQVSFYDPVIQKNGRLDLDPQINIKLNKARCNSAAELVKNNQALIITHNKKYTEQIARMSPKNKHIIDVVHLSDNVPDKENYHGICW